jgi:transketolase N-terminal domain/subunit
MFASHYGLDNLCIAVDVNGLQIDGYTKDVMNVEPLDKKFEAFGCDVTVVCGHDFEELERAFQRFHRRWCGLPMNMKDPAICGLDARRRRFFMEMIINLR